MSELEDRKNRAKNRVISNMMKNKMASLASEQKHKNTEGLGVIGVAIKMKNKKTKNMAASLVD